MSVATRITVILHRCQAAFKRHSFVGSVLVYSCLYSGGDIARQTVQRTPKMDYATSARMAVVGGAGLAPCLYGWYRILDRLVSGRTVRVLVKKVIIDQLVAGSAGVFIFYIGQCLNRIWPVVLNTARYHKVTALDRKRAQGLQSTSTTPQGSCGKPQRTTVIQSNTPTCGSS